MARLGRGNYRQFFLDFLPRIVIAIGAVARLGRGSSRELFLEVFPYIVIAIEAVARLGKGKLWPKFCLISSHVSLSRSKPWPGWAVEVIENAFLTSSYRAPTLSRRFQPLGSSLEALGAKAPCPRLQAPVLPEGGRGERCGNTSSRRCPMAAGATAAGRRQAWPRGPQRLALGARP